MSPNLCPITLIGPMAYEDAQRFYSCLQCPACGTWLFDTEIRPAETTAHLTSPLYCVSYVRHARAESRSIYHVFNEWLLLHGYYHAV